MHSIPFIDRDVELARAEELVDRWGTRLVWCIQAEGGIGKTRLLQEIQRRLRTRTTGPRTSERSIKIALVQEFCDSEWSRHFLAGARAMASDLASTLIESDAHFDYEQMGRQIDSAVEQAADVILVRLGSDEKLYPALQRALDQGKKIITLDNYLRIDGLACRASLEYLAAGTEMAEMMARALNFRGKVAGVWVEEMAMQKRRKNILDTMLMKYPDLELAGAYGSLQRGMADKAYEQTRAILRQHPDLQAIWVTWDEFNRGVVSALKDEKRSDVRVYSFDLCDSEIELMTASDSPWAATVAVDPGEVGRILIRLAAQVAYGGQLERQFAIPMKLVLPEMLRNAGRKVLQPEGDLAWTTTLKATSASRYQEAGAQQLITELLDCDDHSLRIAPNLGRSIASMLTDTQAFEPYLRALRDLRKIERAGVSPERLTQERAEVSDTFVQCFNSVSANKRIVLFLDTTDKLEASNSWNYLISVCPRLKNMVLFVAGRNAASIGQFLEPQLGADVEIIALDPLPGEASARYLQAKQDHLNIYVEPELATQLLSLAQGRPILIDLAAEWRARGIPLEWLAGEGFRGLGGIPEAEREAHQEAFERQLVQHLKEARQRIDQLILSLAIVYPMDAEMIAAILIPDKSLEEARALFQTAQSYVFVKLLPDGRITLHDKMRDMIRDHVWPEIDIDLRRRRRDRKLAADYLAQKADALHVEIDRARAAAEEDDRDKPLVQPTIELEQRYWSTQIDRLRYMLSSAWTEGIALFSQLFEEATDDYQWEVRAVLLRGVADGLQDAIEKGWQGPEERYCYEMALARHKLDVLQLEEGYRILNALKEDYTEDHRQLDIMTRQGNYHEKTGHFADAMTSYKEALDICRRSDTVQQWTSLIRSNLGRVNTSMGRLDEALENYKVAMDEYHHAGGGKLAEFADLINNIGYVTCLQGEYDTALNCCMDALAMRETLGLRREAGYSHSTIGEVYRNWGRYDEAMHHYNEALRIFQAQHDRTWLARLYSYRGAVYRLTNDLDRAEADLRQSLRYEVPTQMPWAHHVLGCVEWNRGMYDAALAEFANSQRLADRFLDVRSQVNNLVAVAEVNYLKWQESGCGNDDLINVILDQKSKIEALDRAGYEFPHHYGRLLRVCGDVAFQLQRYAEAWKTYAHSYALLSKRLGGYGRRTFADELNMLATKIDQLGDQDPALAIQWCQDFRAYWSDKNRQILRRDTLLNMCSIHEAKARLFEGNKNELSD